MTTEDQGPEQGHEKPVVHDRRKIDPETGKVRGAERAPSSADTDGGAPAGPSSADGAPQAPVDGATPTADEGTVEDPIAKAQAEAADLQDQLARRNADVYNVQQEYNNYVRRAKAEAAKQRVAGSHDVLEALMGVLDEIELARQHGDLTGPFAAIAEKLETTLGQRFELARYGDVGEEFDPEVHEALMHAADPEATTTTVTQVMQPGYRAGERVLRAARVAVSGPE